MDPAITLADQCRDAPAVAGLGTDRVGYLIVKGER